MKKLSSPKRLLWVIVVCILAGVLVVLGVLQYRWSREVSDATSSRMRARLSVAMLEFRRDFFAELANIARAFPPDDIGGLGRYSAQLLQWQKTAAHPALIQDVYVWLQNKHKPELVKIGLSDQQCERVSWPPDLESLRENLPLNSGFFQAFSDKSPQLLGLSTLQMGNRMGLLRSGSPEVRTQGEANGFSNAENSAVFKVGAPWMLKSSVPALVRPIPLPPEINRPGLKYDAVSSGWMIIVLNRAFLSEHIFPELTARNFSGIDGLDYDVVIVAGDKEGHTVYSSNPGVTKTVIAEADASMALLGPVSGSVNGIARALPIFNRHSESTILTSPNFGSDTGHRVDHDVKEETWWVPSILPGSHLESWWLVVNNRQGSVEAAVARLQRRNLTLSFGVLAILAATIATIIVASRRAQQLARLQMEFVAGVSHELRTPLTVISSAADNIADGLVQGGEKITQYGAALKGQAAQLRELVEQILMFSATQQNQESRYNLKPAQIADAAELALTNCAEQIRQTNCTVEWKVGRDLPEIMIDVQAFSRCLQNLIGNAIKYGGEKPCIGIETRIAQDEGTVVISVADRGIGIPPEELKQIFEPFYRGVAVREAQMHGNGLGLSVARSIVEDMGGWISVKSAPGQGSLFTVHIPAIDLLPKSHARTLKAPVRAEIS